MSELHLSKSQLLVESIGPWLPTQKLRQSSHLILTTTLLKNSVTIPTTMLLVHGIILEHGVEHISRVDLRAEVTIVSRIVSADQVTEGGLAMAPVIAGAEGFGAVHLRDLSAEAVVGGGYGQSLDILVAGRFVDGHVKDTKVQLAQVEEGIIDMLGGDQTLDDVVWDALRRRGRRGLTAALGLLGFLPAGKVLGGQGRIMATEGAQLGRRPAPVLKHLAGSLHKVPYCVGAVEAGVDGLGHEIVDTVTQLVEQSNHFIMFEEGGLLGGRFGEVADQCSRGVSALAFGVNEALDKDNVNQPSSTGRSIRQEKKLKHKRRKEKKRASVNLPAGG